MVRPQIKIKQPIKNQIIRQPPIRQFRQAPKNDWSIWNYAGLVMDSLTKDAMDLV